MSKPDNDDSDRDARTTPIGLFHYARSYWQSAEFLVEADLKITHPEAPQNFLYYHAIECYLKAFLRQSGISAKELQFGFGHGVDKLAATASGKGLTLTNEDTEVLQLMSVPGNVISARYITTGFYQLATHKALSDTCKRLDDSVALLLRANGTAVRPLEARPAINAAQDRDGPDLSKEADDAESYIEFMNEHDRAIIAYLLAKNQKMFTVAEDGGYAVTLLSRGILRVALRPGQPFSSEDMPVGIPDHIWNALARHRDKFPYKPKLERGVEPHPWRVPWMVR